MTGGVVVAGEALVDLVPDPDGRLSAHPGGGPFNAARAAARLGAPTGFLGRLSTDAYGATLRGALEADGVDLSAAPDTGDPTTLALVELDAGGVAAYRFYTDGTSAPGLTAADIRLPGPPAVLVVGTLGLVFDPAASAIERLVTEAASGTLVVCDPNCRPSAIGDPAAYRARLARVLARTDVVKVSAEDLDWLSPGTPAEDAARDLGPAVALVTLGGDGALVVTPDGAEHVDAPPVRVVDTIGAGDAFVGAIATHLHAAGGVRDVLAGARFACRVAARTCERAGADPPRLSDL